MTQLKAACAVSPLLRSTLCALAFLALLSQAGRAASPATTSVDVSAIPTPAGFPRRYAFRLTSGRGLSVCEAYLQRLNHTEFSSLPYCGLPERTVVPGFSALKRRYLSRAEFDQLFIDATNLIGNQPPTRDYIQRKRPDGSMELVRPLSNFPQSFVPEAWSYDPPIDMENNGTSEQVVIWSDGDRRFPECGLPGGGPQGLIGRGEAAGIIVKPDGTLDRTRSIAVFGQIGTQEGQSYVPRSLNISIFRYRDRTYIAALSRRPSHHPSVYTLGVFTRDNRSTHHLCDYSVEIQETEQ